MLRIATEGDVGEILDIYAPYILTTTITFEYDVPTEAEFLQRFREITARFPWLVCEEDGKILGYASASAPLSRRAYDWCAEPSIYLRPEARGRGLGRVLYGALEALLEEQGFAVSYAIITSENRASIAFHEKLGYRKCGFWDNCGLKFGRWLGVYWLEKRLKSVEIPSCPPCEWSVFMQDEQKIFDILGKLSLS